MKTPEVSAAPQPVVAAADGLRPLTTPQSSAPSSPWWQRGLLVAGIIGLGVLFRSLPRVGWSPLLARVGPAMPLLCAVAVGWMAAYARGLGVLLDGAVGWGRLVYNRFVGDAYNVIMPLGDVGGDPLRVFDLGAEIGTARAVRAIVLDRLTYATSGLLFSAVSSFFAVDAFAWDGRLERLLVGYAVVALLVAVVLSLLATSQRSGRWMGRLLELARVHMPSLPSPLSPVFFARALAWNLLGRAGVLAEIALLLLVLGQAVRLDAVVAIGAIVSVAGAVFFFIPNGIGVNDGATILALKLTGYGEAVGLSIGLARRMRQIILAVAGVALSGLRHPGRSSVRAPGVQRTVP